MKTLLLATFLAAALPSLAEASVRNYFAPEWQGHRLDACLADARSCGKQVADAFCKAQGFDTAILFQREPAQFTRKLDSVAMCEGGNCLSFRQIKCHSTKDDFAGLQQPAD